MKVLITGGSGFIGRRLAPALRRDGHEVTALSSKDCDLTRQGSLQALPRGRYGRIYHLAAWTQAGDFCAKRPGEQWVINQQINTNVLDWWRSEQPQAKLIALGTSVSYATETGLDENFYMTGVPYEKFLAYAMSKRMLYAGLLSLAKQFGLKYLYLVPSTLYGPGYHTDGRQLHFIYDLIRKIARGKLYGDPVILWGDGEQKRELVHVDDFISAMRGLDSGLENDIVNIGAGEEHTIRHFAGLICAKLAYDPGLIKYDTAGYVGARSKCLGTAKLRGLMPGLKLRPLGEGLAETIDWMMSERDKLIGPKG